MNKKPVKLVILIVLLLCQMQAFGIDMSAGSAPAEPDSQLEINKKALFEGSVDAATIMLYDGKPEARKILLDALGQSGNSVAKVAVCKALIQARGSHKPIQQKGDFIEPLLDNLISEPAYVSRLAAEATLLFEYKHMYRQLEKRINASTLGPQGRAKAVEALKRPDMRAVFKLMDLLDDSEAEVVDAAERILNSMGIDVIGKDKKARQQVRREVRYRGQNRFLRDWLIRQDTELRRLQKELNSWKKHYLAAMDKIYDQLDEENKSKFLAEYLNDGREAVRLWALEKVYQSWVGTGLKAKFLAELEPKLINLIADKNRDVRLKTAKMLALMGSAGAVEKLNSQHRVETDDEVKTELFVALGAACYYALSGNPVTQAQTKNRMQTLQLASEYLAQQDVVKSTKGAEVIKKLLEHEGLEDGEVEKYLGLLAKRYKLAKAEADERLTSELLGVMAGLCAQSAYKQLSARAYGPLFEKALSEQKPAIRETAADGLIYIDKTKALGILRKNFVEDTGIMTKLIELAGEVGGEQDLQWLSEKIGSNTVSDQVWQTMLKIFKRSDAELAARWSPTFDSQRYETALTIEQKISFFAIAERKAVGEKKARMLNTVRTKLAHLYADNMNFDKAAEYWGLLLPAAETAAQKETILASLLDVYLRKPNLQAASNLVENSLLEKDLTSDSPIVHSIDSFLAAPPNGVDPNSVVETFGKIKPAEARPNWQKSLNRWINQLKKP